MIITHQLSDYLYDLFPKAKDFGNNIEILVQEIRDYYTYGVYQPTVTIQESTINIEINNQTINDEKPIFDKVVALCEKGDYNNAKPILTDLITKNRTVSEYHRILGQILSDEGNHEAAVNCLIDSLKWNPNNTSALIMMGNIYYRDFKDEATAKKYFDEALAQKPNDFTALSNYATLLLMSGRYADAKQYYEQSYSINTEYPNSAFGLAFCLNQLNQQTVAFEYAIHAIKACKKNDKTILEESIKLACAIGQYCINNNSAQNLVTNYKSKLEKLIGIEIKIVQDDTITTSAKIEFAENYNREYHLLKHKNKQGISHLIMHELVHLEFAIQAKKINQQMLFTSTMENKAKFIKDMQKHRQNLIKIGLSNESISKYYDAIFTGINLQLFNVPIDLFIEDFLLNSYPDLKPIQFISLMNILVEGIESVNNKDAIKLAPPEIYRANKLLNLVTAYHFKELFGIDYTQDFIANKHEITLSQKLYDEYLEYRYDREAGEEYELIKHWSQDLSLNNYFEIISENDFRKRTANPSDILKNIEQDPMDEQDQSKKEIEMEKFIKNQETIGLNGAVMWYMVEALKYFETQNIADIKKIAFEITMVGAHGILPSSTSKYKLANIPNKTFSGYQLLAFYYISFKLCLPEMLPELRLPYDSEYKMAEKMFKEK